MADVDVGSAGEVLAKEADALAGELDEAGGEADAFSQGVGAVRPSKDNAAGFEEVEVGGELGFGV